MTASREWSHRVREITEREFLRDPQRCRVEGCDKPARFERSWFFRATANGRRWHRRERVCLTGAQEFAHKHQLVIERQEVRS